MFTPENRFYARPRSYRSGSRYVEPLQTNNTLDRGKSFLRSIEQLCLTKRAIAPSFVAQFELIDRNAERTDEDGLRRWQKQWAIPLKNEDGTIWQYIVEDKREKRGYVYRVPWKSGNRAYFPPIPPDIRKKIGDRYGVEVPLEGSFWEFALICKKIPILITEGAGKALSALSQGFVAIALYGCTCLGSEDLVPFAKKREVIIAMDSDSKSSAKLAVERALSKHLRPLAKVAKSVKVVTWDATDKGLDDLLANRGVEALERAIAVARDGKDWLFEEDVKQAEHRLETMHSITPDATLSSIDGMSWQKLDELTGGARDIFLVAPKGAGKTVLGADFVRSHENALIPSHRETLARANAVKFGAAYRTDCDRMQGQMFNENGYVRKLSFCNEASHGLESAFEPLLKAGCVAFNDELDQQMHSLHTSSTHAKDGLRATHIDIFWKLQIRATRTLSASADLTDYEVKEFERRTGRKPFVVKVVADKKSYPVVVCEHNIEFLNELDRRIILGETIAVACSSKRDAKWIEYHYKEYGAVAIHRDNINEPQFEGFLEDPNAWLGKHKPKVFIYSPILNTGFSITEPYFKAVFGWFRAQVMPAGDCMQSLERIRPQVPRYIFDEKTSGSFDHCTPKALAKAHRLRLSKNRACPDQAKALDETDPYFYYQAQNNWSRAHLKADIVARLQNEVENVTIEKSPHSEEELKAMRGWVTDSRQEFKQYEHSRLLASPNLAADVAKKLCDRRDLKENEILALKKFDLMDWAVLPPEDCTIERIERDKDGRKRRELERLEKQSFPALAEIGDKNSVERQLQWGKGISTQDVSHHLTEQNILHALGVGDFLDFALAGNSWNNNTPEAIVIADKITEQRNREEIEQSGQGKSYAKKLDFLAEIGIRLPCRPDANANAQIGSVLKRLGLRTKRSQITVDGKRISFYQLDEADLQITKADLNRRYSRFIADGMKLEPSHPYVERIYVSAHSTSNEDITTTVCSPEDPSQQGVHPPTDLGEAGEVAAAGTANVEGGTSDDDLAIEAIAENTQPKQQVQRPVASKLDDRSEAAKYIKKFKIGDRVVLRIGKKLKRDSQLGTVRRFDASENTYEIDLDDGYRGYWRPEFFQLAGCAA